MRKWSYAGALLLALFETANVYFVMPMPYGQRWHSIDPQGGRLPFSKTWCAGAGKDNDRAGQQEEPERCPDAHEA